MTTPQAKNPLHGLTLEAILKELVAAYGWEELGRQIDIRCFTQDPSIASSLKFLRRTPWAREKVESLYLYMRRKAKQQAAKSEPPAAA
ncbi:MAG TPA: VF530 family protein [Rhodocyclaceae bacterium]|nr:VF530 family protein [Rhodocyclaceae bacterium]